MDNKTLVMKKTTRTFIPILFILFYSCGSSDNCDRMTKDDVCVTIINKSGHDTKTLTLQQSNGNKSDLGILKNNSQTSTVYKSAGEDTYVLVAVLVNGDTIKSHEHYTEGGWKMTEILTSDSIRHKHRDY